MGKLNDKWFRWIFIPLAPLVLTVSFGIPLITIYHIPFWKVYLTYVVVSVIFLEINRWLILTIRSKLPGMVYLRQRIVVLGIVLPVSVAILSALLYEFFAYTQYW